MIVRVLTARVPSGNVAKFNQVLRSKLDVLRAQDGLVYAKLARRLNEAGDEEVVLFEEWATPAALWTWTGGHLNKPRLLPEIGTLIEELTITHYEALDMTVEGPSVPLEAQQTILRGRSQGDPQA